jgi:uncharacterized LabA/DUF88 family protein
VKRVILIDGENLSRGIRNLAETLENPASREMLETFDFKRLIQEVLGEENTGHTMYFGTKLHKYDVDEEILEQTARAILIQSRLVNSLQKQGISFIKAGYLRARESKPCANCGHIKWQLQEKGVDVAIAARMITEAKPGVEIILFSADTDLLPAVKTAIKQGAKVVFVGYEYQPVLALAKVASSSRLITKQMIKKVLHG